MSEIKTVFLFKDGERIRVNATDVNRFRKNGWEPEPEPEPKPEPETEPEPEKTDKPGKKKA